MLKEINDYLAGVPATIVAGFFLLLHLLPSFLVIPAEVFDF